MNLELKKRIITSTILFVAVIFCISINVLVFAIATLVITYICFDEWCSINYKYFSHRSGDYFLIKILGFFYSFFIFAYTAFLLRGDSFKSIIFFIIVLCVCICSDIGGYIFGKTIGGKKLTKISPNKTITGSIGSFIFSILPILLFNFQNYIIVSFDVSLKNILLCLIISLVCQLGDLFISYFKRINKVKDTGTILPGHGGLLDRIDGIIFAIPAVYILNVSQIF